MRRPPSWFAGDLVVGPTVLEKARPSIMVSGLVCNESNWCAVEDVVPNKPHRSPPDPLLAHDGFVVVLQLNPGFDME